MTIAPLQHKKIANILFEIDGVNYGRHTPDASWAPTVQTVGYQGGTEDSIVQDIDVTGHVCNLRVPQDFQNPDSLFNFLIDHAGETITVKYKPDPLGPFTIGADITLPPPGALGGARGQFVETTIACPSTAPVRTWESLGAPTITSVTPNTGPDEGGTLVAIVGTGFAGVSAVTFDGVDATAFHVISSTLIHATTPAGTVGAANVVVTNAVDDSAAGTFTYA